MQLGGAVTIWNRYGRQRRCGWFDAVLVRQSATIGGIHGIALTKLDVLDGIQELKVCVGYEFDGETFDYLPAARQIQSGIKPVFETLAGWVGTTRGARSWAELPAEAVKYVRRIEELIGVPVAFYPPVQSETTQSSFATVLEKSLRMAL